MEIEHFTSSFTPFQRVPLALQAAPKNRRAMRPTKRRKHLKKMAQVKKLSCRGEVFKAPAGTAAVVRNAIRAKPAAVDLMCKLLRLVAGRSALLWPFHRIEPRRRRVWWEAGVMSPRASVTVSAQRRPLRLCSVPLIVWSVLTM